MALSTITSTLPAEVDALIAQLRERDTDTGYSDAPVLDVYGRISKNPETGETEKVDRQLEDCLRDLQRRRARLGEVLRDDGVSAWKANAKRKDWATLIERLETRTSSGVIAWHTDRLMRQPRDLERLIAFGEAGLLVASCHGDYNLSNADDRFTLRVLTAAAAKDSDSTSRRRKRKAAAMREKGLRTGGQRAFGEPGTYKGEVVTDEQLTAERDAISWATRSHLDGTDSIREIAREWNRRGLRTVRGQAWDPRFVTTVLTSARIAGLIEKDGVIVGRYTHMEPIISPDEHRALRAMFASRKRGRPASEPYLLTGGLLFCGECGRPMTGRAQTVRKISVRKYACRDRNGGCGHVSIVAEPVEKAVIEKVAKALSDPKHARRVKRSTDALGKATERLQQVRGTRIELAARMGEGKLELALYDAADKPLAAREAALQAEVDALSTAQAQTSMVAATAQEIRERLTEQGDAGRKRRLVRSAFPKGLAVLPSSSRGSNRSADVTLRLQVL